MSAPIAELMQGLPDRVNGDPVLRRLGRFCSTEVLLEASDAGFHLVFARGRLEEVVRGPFAMRPWSFALRGEEDAWRRFWHPCPDPGYNDIFAMSRIGALRIEGDVGPLLAHLRFFKEVLALPRRPVARS